MRYAGLATQLFAALAIAVFAGYKADGWLHTPIPLLVWVLPLLFLSITIFKLIKDTSKKNKGT
jgi:chromate transport protein ChrA